MDPPFDDRYMPKYKAVSIPEEVYNLLLDHYKFTHPYNNADKEMHAFVKDVLIQWMLYEISRKRTSSKTKVDVDLYYQSSEGCHTLSYQPFLDLITAEAERKAKEEQHKQELIGDFDL